MAVDDEKVEISPAVDHLRSTESFDHVYLDVLEGNGVVDSVNTKEMDEEQSLQSQSEPYIKPDPPEMILQPQPPKKLPMDEIMESHDIKRSKTPNKAQLDLPPESAFEDLAPMPPQILYEKHQIDSISKIHNTYSPNNNHEGLEVSEEFESPPSPYPVGDHCKSENLCPNPSIIECIDSSTQPNPTAQSRTPSSSSTANRFNQRRDPSTNNNFLLSDPPPSENPHFFAVEASLVPDLPSAVVVAVTLPSSTHETGSEPSNDDPAPLPRNQPFWKRHIGFIVAGIFFLIAIAILIPILLIFVVPTNGETDVIVDLTSLYFCFQLLHIASRQNHTQAAIPQSFQLEIPVDKGRNRFEQINSSTNLKRKYYYEALRSQTSTRTTQDDWRLIGLRMKMK